MNMMTLSLSDSLKTFIEEQVAERAFETDNEYVRDLISRERDRQHLRRLLLQGLDSPPGPVADDAYFRQLRERAAQRSI